MDETAHDSPVKEGDVLAGKYRVDKVLGVGGMGVVVSATHMQLDQKVALKFMLPWALQNQMAVERFARESKACVKLKSEHVARVLDVGVLESGSPFMVMEFLEGIDLHDLIHQPGRSVPVDDAVDYVLQVCDAVAEAHTIGIVHRDLKPRNLFLTTGNDGNSVVKVLDFGVSKVKGGADLSLTRTTEVVGSPNYMSPEQLRASRDVDERSDIWSLGCILYELLGGQVPFVAETLTQLTALVLMEPPRPLTDLRSDVPPGLVEVVGRCLEKDPKKRFPNVAALATALDAFAPPRSHGLAEKVRRIADVSRPGSVKGSLVPMDRPSLRPQGAQGGGTSVAWAETEVAAGQVPKASRKRTGLVIGIVGAVALVGLGGGGVFLAMRHVPSPTPTAAGSSSGSATLAAAAGIGGATGSPANPASAPLASGAGGTVATALTAQAALSATASSASGSPAQVPAGANPASGAGPTAAGHGPSPAKHTGPKAKRDAGSDDVPAERL